MLKPTPGCNAKEEEEDTDAKANSMLLEDKIVAAIFKN
jgi:hypothetical protein